MQTRATIPGTSDLLNVAISVRAKIKLNSTVVLLPSAQGCDVTCLTYGWKKEDCAAGKRY